MFNHVAACDVFRMRACAVANPDAVRDLVADLFCSPVLNTAHGGDFREAGNAYIFVLCRAKRAIGHIGKLPDKHAAIQIANRRAWH